MKSGCCVDKSCDERTCMELPVKTTCGDCFHFWRCDMLFGAKRQNRKCDFYPRKFISIPDANRARGITTDNRTL